ncbi:unnamed protein product [Effrenium voratum]|nr:unnamed protein product [Effrenium voratum]
MLEMLDILMALAGHGRVGSTLTLFMDLTVVSEALFGDSESDPSRTRSSRTARVGAKVGRVVRVLRLIRIVKLFKAFLSARPKPGAPMEAKV